MAIAAAVMMDVLPNEGVTHLFGNPGSTELASMEALDGGELRYVLGLQEMAVVGMADGYAPASGRPAFFRRGRPRPGRQKQPLLETPS